MSKARILANLISDNAELADGQISVAEVVGAAPLASPTFTGDLTAPEIDLTAIATDISDTAVDVFVYRTADDSDGGAWRKRTQHTSWYNEAASATRGSRKEFPAVAVIVAETAKVTIYDGDDPDMPMWMVFSSSSGNPIGGAGLTSTSAKNGKIAWGNANLGITYSDFIADTIYRHRSGNASYNGLWLGGVSTRSETVSNIGWEGTAVSSSEYIVNNTVNDVAMTVLPNAPIDAATGLPVPTIAVATAGGVSVITDSGAVYDSSYTSAHSSVNIYEDRLSFGYTSFDNVRFVNISEITADGWTGTDYSDTTTPAVFGSNAKVTASNAISNAAGLNFLAEDPTPANGMVAYITSSYNTGWMNGQIKLATLSDTDTANVTGAELVTNGDFATDVSGWATLADGSTIVYSSGTAAVTSAGSYGAAYQTFTTVVGKTYLITWDVTAGTGRMRAGLSASASHYANDVDGISTGNTKVFVPTTTTTYITLGTNSATATANFDNISVRLAEEDRSVNGNGLQVFGTVTKTAVETGADLVGYSGFSSGNYLEQPYNSGLNFGTGDFCVMGWVKSNSHEAGTLFDRGPANGADEYRIFVNLNVDGSILFRTTAAANARSSLQTAANAYPENAWSKFCFVRRNAGTTQEIYVNGKLAATASVAARDIDSVTSTLIVGVARSATNPCNDSSIALFRISATAPSPEQIAKIYNDEKHLFQTGAQATLYGSSDAVTALAHDDTTDLLHVGTSAGRSVFQGLRRVDNTTDAITAAISASNGLVAEE